MGNNVTLSKGFNAASQLMHIDSESAKNLLRPHSHGTQPFIITPKVLGKGHSSTVFLGHHPTTNKPYAIKQIASRNLKPRQLQRIETEVKILQKIAKIPGSEKYFVHLETFFVAPKTGMVYLVSDLIDGCELNVLASRHKNGMAEIFAKKLMLQILNAVKLLHENNVAHRDLKLENIMFDKSTGRIRLIDFGFAVETSKLNPRTMKPVNVLFEDSCGSLDYSAPELFEDGPYDAKKADVWSLGVVAYALLYGRFPFSGPTDEVVCRNIVSGKYRFPVAGSAGVSEEAKSFVDMMLQTLPGRRASVQDLLSHSWLRINQSK